MIRIQNKKSKTTQYAIGGTVAVVILALWIAMPLMSGSSLDSSVSAGNLGSRWCIRNATGVHPALFSGCRPDFQPAPAGLDNSNLRADRHIDDARRRGGCL